MRLLCIVSCIALCGCKTTIDIPASAMFPGGKYVNTGFNKTFDSFTISTTVTGTNGVSTNFMVKIGGWKSDAQYIADAIIQAVAIGAGLASKAVVP